MFKKILFFGLMGACGVSWSCSTLNNHSPEAVVKTFYRWYLAIDAQLKPPLLDERIYCYVEKKTVDALREAYRADSLPEDVNYFTKVQDYDEGDWRRHMLVHPSIALDGLRVVAVTFGSSDKTSLLVLLRRQGYDWKIMKVQDTEPPF